MYAERIKIRPNKKGLQEEDLDAVSAWVAEHSLTEKEKGKQKARRTSDDFAGMVS